MRIFLVWLFACSAIALPPLPDSGQDLAVVDNFSVPVDRSSLAAMTSEPDEDEDEDGAPSANVPTSGQNRKVGPHGPLSGTFVQIDSLPAQSLQAYLGEVKSLGIRTLVVQRTRTKGSNCIGGRCCGAEDYHWIDEGLEKLDTLLVAGRQHDIRIYVGLTLTSHGVCPLSFYNEPNASLTIEDTLIAAREIEAHFGAEPAFAGWYLPDEPNLVGWQNPALAYRYYAGLVHAIRAASARPILASPFMLSGPSYTPVEIASRAQDFLAATGVDILVWQDGVGAEGADVGWYPEKLGVGDILTSVTQLIGSEQTWVVHEAFNCCVTRNPLARGGSYRPTSFARLQMQLEQLSDLGIGQRMLWIQQHHLGLVDPYHHSEAARLLAAYRAYYGLGGGYLQPQSYQWLVEPDPQYPDEGGRALRDRQTGDPKDFSHPAWVGIDNSQSEGIGLVIDLGRTKHIDWVGFHLLAAPEYDIQFPESMTLSCSTGEQFELLGNWHLPIWIQEQVGEYTFSNMSALDQECRHIQVWLSNDHWTFVSEVEIISMQTSARSPIFTGPLQPE